LDVTFPLPFQKQSGKRQMVLQKGLEEEALCIQFKKRDNVMQERKVQNGTVRQIRKVGKAMQKRIQHEIHVHTFKKWYRTQARYFLRSQVCLDTCLKESFLMVLVTPPANDHILDKGIIFNF
jgi:hypothetical protein